MKPIVKRWDGRKPHGWPSSGMPRGVLWAAGVWESWESQWPFHRDMKRWKPEGPALMYEAEGDKCWHSEDTHATLVKDLQRCGDEHESIWLSRWQAGLPDQVIRYFTEKEMGMSRWREMKEEER